MCSGAGGVESDSQELEKAQLNMTNELDANYQMAFAEQQQVLQQQQARLNAIAANPMGLSQQQMATSTTSINENTAAAAKRAMGAAAAFAAQHGGADVGSGVVGQIAGEIGSEAAQSKANQIAQLSNVNQATKQQNLWKALGGMQEVGNAYQGASGTAAGSSAGVAGSSTQAGGEVLQAGNEGWSDVLGALGAAGGALTAGATSYNQIENA